MSISYNGLWKMLIDKNLKKVDLIERLEISSSTKAKMTKNEVLKAVANKVEGASQKDIAVILDAFADVITETLTANHAESVAVGKLGKFKVKTVPERRGKIMMGDRKGEEYVTPQHDEITFKMSKTAKQL